MFKQSVTPRRFGAQWLWNVSVRDLYLLICFQEKQAKQKHSTS